MDKVICNHCKRIVSKDKAHKIEWKEIDLHWYYCDRCEREVFGGGGK